VIEADYDWSAMLNDWLDQMLVKDGLSRGTALNRVKCVKKWLKVNELEVNWSKVDLPRAETAERDQIPTREEPRKLVASADLADRVLLMLGMSSGLRLSTLLGLRLKDIDLKREIPIVNPIPETTKSRRTFVTSLTPGAKQAALLT
jgi:integrase